VNFVPCDPPGAECATVELPLGSAGQTIGVAVARLPAPVQPARGQVWFVTGGPGDSGVADLANVANFFELASDLDLYTFDPRGTGGTHPLTCPEQQDPESPDGVDIVGDEWPPCAAAIGESEADWLPWFTTTTTAGDLVALTDQFATPDGVVYWWGLSYGTFLVQRALALAPARPTAVILDGLVPADWSFVEFDGGFDQVARAFLRACGEDPACAGHFDAPPEAFAETVLADLDDGHCARLGLDAATARLLTGVLLQVGEPYASAVPSVWSRLGRCSGRDKRAFVHLFDALFPEDGGGRFEEKSSHSPVLQRHISYADLWEPTVPSAAALQDQVDRSVSSTAITLRFAELDQDWPVVPGPDPLDDGFPATTVPILALAGGYDPTMPVDRLAPMAAWVEGAGGELIVVPNAHHVTLNHGDCPASLYRQFLAAPVAPDAGCVAEMPPIDWDGDPEFNEALWGTDDRWGDRAGACSTALGGASVWPLVAAAGLRRVRSPPR
jgi:pimeloyl-ACP methyl ester carboxylesterase